MTEQEENIWKLVNDWCDNQQDGVHIPDQSRRYLMDLIMNELPYRWKKYPENKPEKYGKHFVIRKDGKSHWETWNGSGWAYNGTVIEWFCVINNPNK